MFSFFNFCFNYMLFPFNVGHDPHMGNEYIELNNYIVRSYRDVIVVTNTAATRRTNKAKGIFLY